MSETNVTERSIIAAKKLVKRYESITIDEIKKARMQNSGYNGEWMNIEDLVKLTGFGYSKTCTLCRATTSVIIVGSSRYPGYVNCTKCVYQGKTQASHPCNRFENEKTYLAILNNKSARGLLTAFRNRAKHIKKILEKLNEN